MLERTYTVFGEVVSHRFPVNPRSWMMAKLPGDPYIAKIIAMGSLQISPGGPNDKGRYTVDVIVDDEEMLGMV